MARPRVVVNNAGIRELLRDPGVVAELESRMADVLEAARFAAPVESGEYRESLKMWSEYHTGRRPRMATHVGSDAPHALQVEGAHGVLSRALDAAGGRRDG